MSFPQNFEWSRHVLCGLSQSIKLMKPVVTSRAHPKRAAVLVPLCSVLKDNTRIPSILFTQRSFNMRIHKGEVSFPGGRFDGNDRSAVHTALRETFEELPGLKQLFRNRTTLTASNGQHSLNTLQIKAKQNALGVDELPSINIRDGEIVQLDVPDWNGLFPSVEIIGEMPAIFNVKSKITVYPIVGYLGDLSHLSEIPMSELVNEQEVHCAFTISVQELLSRQSRALRPEFHVEPIEILGMTAFITHQLLNEIVGLQEISQSTLK